MNSDFDTNSAEQIAGTAFSMKQDRNMRLTESDWSVLPDNGLSEEDKAPWIAYRQQLRDITSHAEWPFVPEEDLPTSPSGTPFWGDQMIAEYFPVAPDNHVLPTSKAPVPTVNAENVTSLFGEVYNNITIHELSPNWAQSGQLTRHLVQHDGEAFELVHIERLNWQGCNIADFGQDHKVGVDVSQHTAVYMDFWLEEDGAFRFGMASHDAEGVTDDFVQRMVTINGYEGWNTVNLSLEDFAGIDTTNITQVVWDNIFDETSSNVSNIYIDNLYFNNESAAPVTQVT